jgi:hypothetical protein
MIVRVCGSANCSVVRSSGCSRTLYSLRERYTILSQVTSEVKVDNLPNVTDCEARHTGYRDTCAFRTQNLVLSQGPRPKSGVTNSVASTHSHASL